MRIAFLLTFTTGVLAFSGELENARDAQDHAALDRLVQKYSAAAQQAGSNADAQYKAAVAYSYAAEVAAEKQEKAQSGALAENGIKAAERAVSLNGNNAEYHRILGNLCGQAIPGVSKMLAFKYGNCAMKELNKAIQLDGKSAIAYVSHGVGYQYLPPALGGGTDAAIQDFQKAIQMDPKLVEAHLWLGIALRKAGRNAEARKALETAVRLNPNRVWAKQQLDKTPPK